MSSNDGAHLDMPNPTAGSHWLDRIRASETNPLADHYRHFAVSERLLLTGHSHQAWPDCARDGLLHAFDDAAGLIDDKWEAAFAVADRVRAGWAKWIGDTEGSIALGPATHDLLIRFFSALDLRKRPRLVTTAGEFHALRRQLARLEEEGVEVVRVPVGEVDQIADRLAREVDDRTAAVLVSAVLFRDSRIVPGLRRVHDAARRVGAEMVVDAYHAVNVVPFSIGELGLDEAWITGGGYKYAQLGEGNAFLRVPPGRRPRPVLTGWFAEFDALAEAPAPGLVPYGPGAAAFATATYDPSSNYRAAAVLDHFERLALDPFELRRISQHQVDLLRCAVEALDLDPSVLRPAADVAREGLGGFLALETPAASALDAELRRRGVFVDHRDDVVRLGPAPYLSDTQLRDAVEQVGEAVGSLSSSP